MLSLVLQAPEGATQPQFAPFESTVKGWAIERPVRWAILDDPGGPTLLIAPGETAICGIHTATDAGPDLASLSERFLRSSERYLRQKHGLASRVVARRPRRLGSGEPAVDVIVELTPGGRARRLFTLAPNGWGHVVDCETSTELWSSHEAVFERLFRSFRLVGTPAAQAAEAGAP